MKKTLLLMLFALAIMGGKSFAQNSQVATRYAKAYGTTETYYGDQAFINALQYAEDGDIITLSGGTFDVSNQSITKAVTVRGAGMKADATLGTLPTVLTGDFRLTVSEGFSMEGIYHNGTISYSTAQSPKFIKCRLNEITSATSSSSITDIHFIHCKIVGKLALRYNCTATCINSVVNNPTTYGEAAGGNVGSGRFAFTNCFLYTNSPLIKTSAITNCVIYDNLSNGEGVFDNTNVIIKNVGCSSGGIDIFPNADGTNLAIDSYNNFTSLLGLDLDGGIDDLTYSMRWGGSYLGTDNTQVGIYGGTLPYDEKVTGPRITAATVGTETTSDGKLSVDITVSAQ